MAENDKCRWCGKVVTPEDASLDHEIPKSKGGRNSAANLFLACKGCNVTRGNMDSIEFAYARARGLPIGKKVASKLLKAVKIAINPAVQLQPLRQAQ